METQLPYDRMGNEEPNRTNPGNNFAAQPTVVVVAQPQKDYKQIYNGRLALMSGTVQLVCGILAIGLNVSFYFKYENEHIPTHMNIQLEKYDDKLFPISLQIGKFCVPTALAAVSDGIWCGVIVS